MFLKVFGCTYRKTGCKQNIEIYKKDCNKNVIKNYLTNNNCMYKMYNVNARYKT